MNTRRWLVTIAICVALFAAFAAFKTLQIKSMIEFAESFPEPSETVETTTVAELSLQSQLFTLGEVVAPQMVELRNELEGRVTQVNFQSGSKVKQGQLLLQQDIAEEQARLKAAQARLKLAKLDRERVRKLRKNRTVSEERLDQAEAQYNIAQADIAALQATIDKKTLRAPFDAHTGLHEFEIGELIAANTLITTLVGLNDYRWVDFTLPLGKADVTIGTQVSISQTNGKQFTGEIIAMDSVMSANSRNRRFRAKVNTEELPHNAAVNVRVASGDARQLPVIPATAVRRDGMGDYVYILLPDEQGPANAYRAQRRSITLLPEYANEQENSDTSAPQVAVIKGLKVGELIAVNGSFKLREGLLTYAKSRLVPETH
ncbi:MAG: efflux RND transporter periplasmic adaptor subunit [Pseudomonadota bacterium]|nr:efflux RND transporter periplasmic adaptor subunit [Pseudomonadota bacterium]